MADIGNIYNRHVYQKKKIRKSNISNSLTKFENNGYFLITPRIYCIDRQRRYVIQKSIDECMQAHKVIACEKS